MFRVCHDFLSVHCSLVVTCWERANLLAPLYAMFNCVFVTLPCGVLGQVCYLIVLNPEFCLLTYFVVTNPAFYLNSPINNFAIKSLESIMAKLL